VAFVFNVLSVVYFRAGRTVEAESYGRQCITRAEALLGPRNPSLGLYLANYAAVLKQMGRKSEAKEIQQRAGAILAQSAHGNSSGLTVNVDAIR
jgi:hypothetical protein